MSERGQILSPEQKGNFTCEVFTVFNFSVVIVLLLKMQNFGLMRNIGFIHLCPELFQISSSQPAVLLLSPHPSPPERLGTIWSHFWLPQLGDSWDVTGFQWVEVKGAANILQCTGQCLSNKDLSTKVLVVPMLRNPVLDAGNVTVKKRKPSALMKLLF